MDSLESSIRTGETLPPLFARRLPFSSRLSYGIQLWAFKILIVVALRILRVLKLNDPESTKPTHKKTYEIRPTLENRIFIPQSYKPGGRALRLYIDIHGGGFALCDPETDDEFCHPFANKFNICVVSINYRKAPWYPYPIAVQDAAEIAKAVLGDDTLPADKTKVAIGGFSASGNLALSIAQTDGLRGKLKGLVAFYPVVDWSMDSEQKLEQRERTDKPDALARTAKLFNWGYLANGQDLRDPLLSPIFASRDALLRKICLIGAEVDMLCPECEILAERLGAAEEGVKQGTKTNWTKGGIRFEKVMDWEHGITHVKARGEREVARKKMCEEVYERAGQWLQNEVYI